MFELKTSQETKGRKKEVPSKTHNKNFLDIVFKEDDRNEEVMAIIDRKMEELRIEVFKTHIIFKKKGATLAANYLASFPQKSGNDQE